MAELFERWFGVASVRWATATARNVRSIIDRQLTPNIGDVLVRELTVVTIDEFYAQLRRRGRFKMIDSGSPPAADFTSTPGRSPPSARSSASVAVRSNMQRA